MFFIYKHFISCLFIKVNNLYYQAKEKHNNKIILSKIP